MYKSLIEHKCQRNENQIKSEENKPWYISYDSDEVFQLFSSMEVAGIFMKCLFTEVHQF